MDTLEFQWDRKKAEANLQTHGVSFELASTVFSDVFAIEFLDDRRDYHEQRFATIGTAKSSVPLFVVHTERDKQIRIISARRATR